jgi:hypothetical protein
MPKTIVNNRINYCNLGGRVIAQDLYVNQGVKNEDSPTFANLRITADATIEGNLYVEGNATILSSNVIQFKDNILLINDAETGAGVTLNQSGLEIKRGTSENYRMVWNETTQRFEVGVISNLQPVAIREDSPLPNGIMTWNNSTKLIQSVNTLENDIIFSSTTNSTDTSTGAVIIKGGLAVAKDIVTHGKLSLNDSVLLTESSGSFKIEANNKIYLEPTDSLNLPFEIPFVLGNVTGGAYLVSSTSGSITINAKESIKLTPLVNVSVPNQIPIIFSTPNEKIYTDSSNNMVIEGSQNIHLTPANGAGSKSVIIPIDSSLVFGTDSDLNRKISADITGDLTIEASNNILLNAAQGQFVRVPTDVKIKLGGTGDQSLSSDSNDNLNVSSSNDINVSAANINIPSETPLTFGSGSVFIKGDSSGSLLLNASNYIELLGSFRITNTENATSATTGAFYILGGMGMKEDLYTESGVIIDSNKEAALLVKNNTTDDIFKIDTVDTGHVSINAGNGSTTSALTLSNNNLFNATNLIELSSHFDTNANYLIGRGDSSLNEGRSFTFNLPSYSEYNNDGMTPKLMVTTDTSVLFSIESDTGNIRASGEVLFTNNLDASDSTTASVVLTGGLGVNKSIYTTGKYISAVNSNNALQINKQDNTEVFNVNTDTSNVTLNNADLTIVQNDNLILTVSNEILTITGTTDSTDTSSGSIIVNGGMAVQKTFNAGDLANFYNGIDMKNTVISNLADPVMQKDAATKAYVDLVKQGLYVKDSVNVSTTSAGNLATDFIPSNFIDDYRLILGDRILIKNQTDPVENGIYIITNEEPIRADDLQTNSQASGTFVFIENGTYNGNTGWICNSPGDLDLVGTDALSYTQFTGIGDLSAGQGIYKFANSLNVSVDNTSLEINGSNQITLSSNGISLGLSGGSGNPLRTSTDQSHVTKLGTIEIGSWNADPIDGLHGGTGRSSYTPGAILFGGDNGLSEDTQFHYDNINQRLGVGTNNPEYNLEISNDISSTIKIAADVSMTNPSGKPEIILSYSGTNNSTITMPRVDNDYSVDTYSGALIISNNQTDETSRIQLATNQKSQLTILSNGFVGIATSSPSYNLDLDGSMNSTGLVTFTNTLPSTSDLSASVVMSGGLSINCNQNSTDQYNGGSLTVIGGASISQDLYVGGSINSQAAANLFSYMTITATDGAVNASSGAFVTFGGITVQSEIEAVNSSNGGGLLVLGGASVNKSMYIGKTLNVDSGAYLNNLYITSNSYASFIESPDHSRTSTSFNPIHFTKYNNTTSSILTIHDIGTIVNDSGILQIGGSVDAPDGYQFRYVSNDLSITPVNNNSTIRIGSSESLSNLTIYGPDSSTMEWYNGKLKMTDSDVQIANDTYALTIFSPDTDGNLYMASNGTDLVLNIGQNSSGGKVTTVLSNNTGDASVVFDPSNVTCSNLNVSDNVYSTFNGPSSFNDRLEMSGNALHQTISNGEYTEKWIYFGMLDNYCEIDVSSVNGNLKFSAGVSNGNLIASHSYSYSYGDASSRPRFVVHSDTFSSLHLFLCVLPESQVNVDVLIGLGNKFVLIDEGNEPLPNGVSSNFLNTWSEVYASTGPSNRSYSMGDLSVEGPHFKTADPLPILGYNNDTTTNMRDLGTLYQRYQKSNDSGYGEVVNDSTFEVNDLPSQSTATLMQVILNSTANPSDDYYNGCWIKMITGNNSNQVRQIVGYNGNQRVATLNESFITSNPVEGDILQIYNRSFVANYYDALNETFILGYTNSSGSTVSTNGTADLKLSKIVSTDTTTSLNATTGSFTLNGSISLCNTAEAISSTSGGTITTLGGMGIGKSLMVNSKIGIGASGFTPLQSLHINSENAGIRLESSDDSPTNIDFVKGGDTFSMVYTGEIMELNQTINISNQKLVGINTTNVGSLLTLASDNYISVDSTSGFLGLSGSSSTDGSRILLNGATDSTEIYSGSTGSIRCYNGLTESLTIDENGITSIFSTQTSTSATKGALTVMGGMSISATENASSYTSGGALTINGGISIKKDLYLGGDLHIAGTLSAPGNFIPAILSFSDSVNCTLNEYRNSNLMIIGSSCILSFEVSVIPDASDLNTQITFSLPELNNDLSYRGQVLIQASGYTDSAELTVLYNVLSVGITGTKTALVKFQSASTDVHYLQIQATYAMI